MSLDDKKRRLQEFPPDFPVVERTFGGHQNDVIPLIGAPSINKDDFAEEFPPTSPAIAGIINVANDEKGQAADDGTGMELSLARGTDNKSNPIAKKYTEVHPVSARQPTVTNVSSADVQPQSNNDTVPGAFLTSQIGTTATRRTLTESRGVNEEFEPRVTARVDEESGNDDHDHHGDYFIAEANAINEDIPFAQVATQKWYQRHFYRGALIGSVMTTCILVGVVIALLARPTGNSNSALTPVEPVPLPTMLAPQTESNPPTTPAPTVNLASEQIACDFIAQPSLSDCRLQRTVVKKNGLFIPSEIGLLTKLTYLSLENAALTGNVPTTICNLTELRHLSFRSNSELLGSIPSLIGNLVQLTHLDFADAGLTGSIPSSIGSLTQLQLLDLYWNELTGIIPLSVVKLVQLVHVSLAANQLIGGIPSSIDSLTLLTYLDFGSNQLNGSKIPTALGLLTKLTYLSLENSALTGTIPTTIWSLIELRYLSFRSNKELVGSIPTSIANLVQLTYLDFADAGLTGSIPSSIGSLTQLQLLDLYWNELTGIIPSFMESLTQLTYLDFGSNKLNGTVPFFIGRLTMLTTLGLNRNGFTGSIPPSIGDLKQLETLWWDVGSFSGGIPSSIGEMTSLVHLNLGTNSLTGSVPSSIAGLTSLTFLSLGSNELTGTLPSSLCPIVTGGIYIDCGEILCDCCKVAGSDPGVAC
jgi:Leucine-rich repeat (LRR) protein